MTRVLRSHLQNVAFSGLVLQEILDRPLDDETPQARLKEIGMMTVLYAMSQAHQPLTLTNISELLKLTRSGAKETVDLLVRRGLLNETMVKNSMGRGTARKFEISKELLDKLRSFDTE
ncbi:MarR family transcriptional regulator [Phyllobacterium zundukense]|uniref:MarR family transcriptional regulator n=1 Tax=Phyllobacterium zundukense TaxID=1867719 RepID=A0ACD4CW16_9HYPH|nr:MarR family transcriptional regulator [Phyllobacterium zundukense]UXN57780.1 MarR family transcriptional regulator [Phyllobacterium zundukense]